MSDEYTVRECIEYAISCLKNRDTRHCTINWLERALAQMPKPCDHNWEDTGELLGDDKILRCANCGDEKWVEP